MSCDMAAEGRMGSTYPWPPARAFTTEVHPVLPATVKDIFLRDDVSVGSYGTNQALAAGSGCQRDR